MPLYSEKEKTVVDYCACEYQVKGSLDDVTSDGPHWYWAFLLQVLSHVVHGVSHLPGHLDNSVVLGIPAVTFLFQKQGGVGQRRSFFVCTGPGTILSRKIRT